MERGKILKLIQATQIIAERSNYHINVHDMLWCVSVPKCGVDQLYEKLCLVEHKYYGWLVGNATKILKGDNTIAIKKDRNSGITQMISIDDTLSLFLVERIIKVLN